jgi:hypothetical protein
VGPYAEDVALSRLAAGLDAIERQPGPTMLVVPDALLLPAIGDYGSLVRRMLDQCGRLGDRVAIVDVFGADALVPDRADDLDTLVARFREAIGDAHLSYGMAYFPCLYVETGRQAEKSVAGRRVVPASGAIAGVFATVDSARGVWGAPANISVAGAAGTTFVVTDALQQQLHIPVDGKAVNPIRDFPAHGPLVWGARTLDGNSHDYRYIAVRRTVMYIEQSIEPALGAFAQASNDAQTWLTVTATISNFLTNLWRQGGLKGDKASDAFSVHCGLGTTMSDADILEGRLRVLVGLQLIRAGEFIELTFVQQMQTAATGAPPVPGS